MQGNKYHFAKMQKETKIKKNEGANESKNRGKEREERTNERKEKQERESERMRGI